MRLWKLAVVLFVTVAMSGSLVASAQQATPIAGGAATPVTAGPFTVLASGLTNPRGFAWSPDGTLYVALAGNGGDTVISGGEGFTAHIGLG